jgi:hypothetical protein
LRAETAHPNLAVVGAGLRKNSNGGAEGVASFWTHAMGSTFRIHAFVHLAG